MKRPRDDDGAASSARPQAGGGGGGGRKPRTQRSCAPCADGKRSCDHEVPCGRCKAAGTPHLCVVRVDRRSTWRLTGDEDGAHESDAADVAFDGAPIVPLLHPPQSVSACPLRWGLP